MPRRLSLIALAAFVIVATAMALLPGATPQPVEAQFTCGATGSGKETNSKLQIFVSGPRTSEVNWAFYVSPNPYDLGQSLKVIDNGPGDLNSSKADMLLEDVCTTTVNDTYTVSLDPAVTTPCPLVQNTLTRNGPGPTPSASDPSTAAFYFQMNCPTPTPTPSPTPTPAPIVLTITVTPHDIPCGSTALVTTQAKQGTGWVPDGTPAKLAVTTGTLDAPNGIFTAGTYSTILRSAACGVTGIATSTLNALTATAPYSIGPAATPVPAPPPPPPALPPFQQVESQQIRPPNTGEAGLK